MKIVPLMLLLLAGSILVSCQKEISSETKTEEETQGDRLLTRITYTEDDSRFIDSFEYDVQDRCTRYVSIYYDLTNPNPQPYIYFHEFYYNGNEMLPFKITDTSQGRGMSWLIHYDAQKRKTVDSFTHFGSGDKQVVHYAYSTNRIIATTTYSLSGTISKDTFDYDGNNVSRYGVGMENSGIKYTWHNIATYDTRINPVNKMNIATSVLFGANGTLGTPNGLNKNNVLTETYSNNGAPAELVTYQYVYDADNYPLSATYVGPGIQGTITFDYKK